MESSYEFSHYLKIKEVAMDKDKTPECIKIILSDTGKDKIIFPSQQPKLKIVSPKVFRMDKAPVKVEAIRVPKEQ
jgi:hypothetical protein